MTQQAFLDDTPAERWLEGLMRGISVLRVPLLLAIVMVLALTVSEQLQELYRILVQEVWPPRWLAALSSLVVFSLVLWQIARVLAQDHRARGVLEHPAGRWVLKWGPHIIVTLPLLGAAWGIWRTVSRPVMRPLADETITALDRILSDLTALKANFYAALVVCVVLAVVLFMATVAFERNREPSHMDRLRRVFLVLAILIAGASVVFISLDPVRLSQFFGTIPIFSLWMCILGLVITLLTRYYVLGVPVFSVLVLLAVFIEFKAWGDNHQFRGSTEISKLERPLARDAFNDWLASRADAADFQRAGKPYPIYIVAAEGGGLYAAYNTAQFLSRMQDVCSNFAQHLFAISGVSGGSLGAAVFAGLAKDSAKNEPARPCVGELATKGNFQKRAEQVLSNDLLSPVVWAALFPDFVQRFIPHPILQLDRGLALEYALEGAWHKETAQAANPLASYLRELCEPNAASCATGATPVLAFNVTNVETGMQMVLSPVDFGAFSLYQSKSRRIYDVFSSSGSAEDVDIKLSTAIGLSSRFPWISPPGWYTFPDKQFGSKLRRMTFVDGGYVDNSGVATALGIAQYIQDLVAAHPARPSVSITLIMISAAWMPFDRVTIVDEPRNHSQGELVVPLGAAVSAWQGRGFTTQYDVGIEANPNFRVLEAAFYYNYMALPLGWQMSQLSRDYLNLFRGEPEKCDESKIDRSLSSHAALANSYIERAHCVAARIVKDLTPTAPPAPADQKPITPVQ